MDWKRRIYVTQQTIVMVMNDTPKVGQRSIENSIELASGDGYADEESFNSGKQERNKLKANQITGVREGEKECNGKNLHIMKVRWKSLRNREKMNIL